MPDNNVNNDKPMTIKRKKKRTWLAAIALVLTAIIACLFRFSWNSKSIDQQIAEIEAARAIPDSENAAFIYNKLIQDPYPAGVDTNQYIIDTLTEAGRLENCRFPIISGAEGAPPQMDRLRAIKSWALLLRTTAEKDLAAGRVDDAVVKWRCILQIGSHLRRQPLFADYLVAIGIEAIPLHDARVFIVEDNAAGANLDLIEAMPVNTEDRWPATFEAITPVQELADRKRKQEWGLLNRIKYDLQGLLRRPNEREP
ncbi:MAG: hypothetical protein ACYS8Z_21265, partial [Planctomycetota bacterium]